MDSFLCIKDGLVDDEGREAFYEGDYYDGYIDDYGDLRIEDEYGDDVCLEDGEWQKYFEEG